MTYTSVGGTEICPTCGYGSSHFEKLTEWKKELAETGDLPDKILEKGSWALHIFYRLKGSKSEGQHGVLIHEGETVEPSRVGEILETDLGKIKYYLHPRDMEHPWDRTGC
jgi:hypothetical protein